MNDLVRKKLLALLRVINFKIETAVDSNELDWQDEHQAIKDPDIIKALKSLRKNEKEYLHDILKAMTLITSGNVESVRSPNKYSRASAKDFKSIYSFNTMEILEILGINYSSTFPTRQDYELAKKLLPIIGSDYLSDADFFQDAAMANLSRDALAAGDERLLGYKTTWRGLAAMDNKTIAAALRVGSSWDIQRGVSTSADVGVSLDYGGIADISYDESDITSFVIDVMDNIGVGAERKGGPSSILFKFLNPKGAGMIARRLSAYGSENETILSGKATIEGWSLQFICYDSSLQTVNRNYKHVTFNSVNNINNMVIRDEPYKQKWKVTETTNLDSKSVYRAARVTVSRGTIDINGVQHKVMNNKFALILQAKIS